MELDFPSSQEWWADAHNILAHAKYGLICQQELEMQIQSSLFHSGWSSSPQGNEIPQGGKETFERNNLHT